MTNDPLIGPEQVERWESLRELLAQNKRLTIEGVSTQLQVSRSTVRRDFMELERRGLAHRVRGGVVVPESPFSNLAASTPEAHHTTSTSPADLAIARAASEHVRQGQSIGFNGGLVAQAAARQIADREDFSDYSRDSINVVTSSVRIAWDLTHRPHVRTIGLGGVTHPRLFEYVGPLAVAAAERLWIDTLFIDPIGIHPVAGITTNHDYVSEVLRTMVGHSTRVIVLARPSRIGVQAWAGVCPLSEVDTVITTDDADQEVLERFESQGIGVERVPLDRDE